MHPTRVEATNAPTRFDSESPQQEGQFGTEGAQTNDRAESGVAYLHVEGEPDVGSENYAILSQQKDWFTGYHRSRGHVVNELPASAFAAHHDRMLARLREMAATIGDDFVAIPFSFS
ncbi:hypothetical protein ACIBPB_23345 [Micromonospora sp. NPDC049836]|uniref:hypothetical protein n=1 Tax=Micromonospora sp. NPDC049836 TaxID=3364274 RepID=UPI00378D8175